MKMQAGVRFFTPGKNTSIADIFPEAAGSRISFSVTYQTALQF
jgi:hypothetical protein